MAKGKGRKRLPKRFASDFINTYQGVDPVKTAAHEIFQNRNRVRSNTASKKDPSGLPILNNTFTQPVPTTISPQRYRGPVQKYRHEYTMNDEGGVSRKHVQIKNMYEWGKSPEEVEEATTKVWLKTPRGEAQDKATVERNSKTLYKVFQSDRQQKVVEYHSIILRNLPGLVLKLHFQGMDHVFEQVSKVRRSYSRTYRGRETAMLAFHTDTISWSVVESL